MCIMANLVQPKIQTRLYGLFGSAMHFDHALQADSGIVFDGASSYTTLCLGLAWTAAAHCLQSRRSAPDRGPVSESLRIGTLQRNRRHTQFTCLGKPMHLRRLIRWYLTRCAPQYHVWTCRIHCPRSRISRNLDPTESCVYDSDRSRSDSPRKCHTMGTYLDAMEIQPRALSTSQRHDLDPSASRPENGLLLQSAATKSPGALGSNNSMEDHEKCSHGNGTMSLSAHGVSRHCGNERRGAQTSGVPDSLCQKGQ